MMAAVKMGFGYFDDQIEKAFPGFKSPERDRSVINVSTWTADAFGGFGESGGMCVLVISHQGATLEFLMGANEARQLGEALQRAAGSVNYSIDPDTAMPEERPPLGMGRPGMKSSRD